MSKYRMRFSKNLRAVYISHLDLMRTMQRSFMRSGCQLQYSEGFNPHPLISIALPLSVGISSDCEILDFKMRDDISEEFETITERLNNNFPEGIFAQDIYLPEHKVSEIKWLKITGIFSYENGVNCEVLNDLNEIYDRPEIKIMRRTKRGEKELELKSNIREINFSMRSENEIECKAVISAQEPTINPAYLMIPLEGKRTPDLVRFHREEIYDDQMNIFK